MPHTNPPTRSFSDSSLPRKCNQQELNNPPTRSFSDSPLSQKRNQQELNKMTPEQIVQYYTKINQIYKMYYTAIDEGNLSDVYFVPGRSQGTEGTSSKPMIIKVTNPTMLSKGTTNETSTAQPIEYKLTRFELVTEYRGQDLYMIDSETLKLDNPDIAMLKERRKMIFTQITSQLNELHQDGFSHRDIKAENICWNQVTKKASLIDFGDVNNRYRLTVTDALSHPVYFLLTCDQEKIMKEIFEIKKSYSSKIQSMKDLITSDKNKPHNSNLDSTPVDLEGVKQHDALQEKLEKVQINSDKYNQKIANIIIDRESICKQYREKLPSQNKCLLLEKKFQRFDFYSFNLTELQTIIIQIYAVVKTHDKNLAQKALALISNIRNNGNFNWKVEKIADDINDFVTSLENSSYKPIFCEEITRLRQLSETLNDITLDVLL